MRPYRIGLRHTLPVLAVVALGNPVSALPRGPHSDAVPGARPAPFPVRGTATVELRYPTFRLDGTAEVSLVNTGEERTVVAWKLDYDRNGFRNTAVIRDGYVALVDRLPMRSWPTEGFLVEPGAEERIELPFPLRADLAEGHTVGLALDVVLFDDLSFEGDANEARLLFAERARSLKARERWLPRVREIVRGSHTAAAAVARLSELSAAMEAAGDAGAARLRAEVRETISLLRRDSDRAVLILEDFLRLSEARVAAVRRSTPAEHRRGDGRAGLRRRTAAGEWECGTVSAGKTTSVRPCDQNSNEYRVTERWSFGCDDPTHNGQGSVDAVGHCGLGLECPPEFEAPETGETGMGWVRWVRAWQDRLVYVGFWARCADDGQMKRLTHDCPCTWVESPPTEDGPEGEDAPAPGDGTCTYECSTPILVDLDRGGFRFTDLDGGVDFDIDADAQLERVSWTAPDSGDAFLALDRDGNGAIDGGHELFGDETDQPPTASPHGYRALAVFDDPAAGGDGDGRITPSDAVFGSLRLWTDHDHDGASQPAEMMSLAAAGVESIDLDYRENRSKDRHGNELRYRSLVRLARGTTQSVDVFFLTEEP